MNIVQTETMASMASASISSNESMGTHASHDDDDVDTEDESSSDSENCSDKENDPWTTLINEAVSKVWDQYKEILQALLMEGHDEKQSERGRLCANSTCIPKGTGGCPHG